MIKGSLDDDLIYFNSYNMSLGLLNIIFIIFYSLKWGYSVIWEWL